MGVVIPDISHPFYSTFLKYTEEALYERGYKTMVCETIERENMEEEFLSMLNRQAMDGIIMGGHSLKQGEYASLDKPVVAFDRELGKEIPIVRADHEQGGVLAAHLFMEKGCKNVVHVSGASFVSTPAHRYHTSFVKEMKKKGIMVREVEMPHNAFKEEDFRKVAAGIFEEYPGVDGIFGADMVILSCMREAFERKIAVPDTLHLLAYDGTYVTRMGICQVSAIVQPIKSLAYACVERMDELIRKQPVKNMEIVFPVSCQDGQTL